MIYSCILYDGEKDLLEIRLNELSLCNEPVHHIIIEANQTHTGIFKPLTFEKYCNEFYDRFDITYSVAQLPDGTPRGREAFQRNEIMNCLRLASPSDDDIVIISDVDEIPRAKQVNKFKRDIEFAALILDKYAYFLNWVESEQSWDRARICTYKYLHDKTPEQVRNSGYDFSIHQAGWHYSWVIAPLRKLSSFSHTELDTEENVARVQNKENIWNNDQIKQIEINLSHPEYLVKNIEKFKHLIR